MAIGDSNDSGDNNVVDLRVRQFGVVCGYLQYENTVYWTRSQLFVVANAALIGLLANALPTSTKVPWVRIYTLLGPFLVGFVVCYLWLKILWAAHGWIDHWHAQLQHLEPQAFPDNTLTDAGLFSKVNEHERQWPIKRSSLQLCYTFIAFWSLVLVYMLVLAVMKISGCELF